MSVSRSPDGLWELMPTALGIEVVTVGERRARARIEKSVDASFSADGRSIAFRTPARASFEVPFRTFSSLDDLDREARAIERERSIATKFISNGNGVFTTLRYTKRDVDGESVLLELAKRFGPPPIWVIAVPELDDLERAAGPLFDKLGGPRFEAAFRASGWWLRWWPRGGGEVEASGLREAVAQARKSLDSRIG